MGPVCGSGDVTSVVVFADHPMVAVSAASRVLVTRLADKA